MALHIRCTAMVMLALALGACQTMGDVTPGQGLSATIAGHPYDRVWDASLKVAERHFAIREQSKPDGVILAERTGVGSGWIGIYLTAAGADAFRVEVVRLGKYVGQLSFTNWPQTTLREIQASLGPAPPKETAPKGTAPKETAPKEGPAPATAPKETADPKTAPKEVPAPETAPKEAPAPETAPKETPAPETAPKEAPAPETAPKEAPAPETAPKETPAPETAPKEAPA